LRTRISPWMPLLCCLCQLSAEIGEIPEGYTPIFNGKDLSGWHISRSNHHGTTLDARVEKGVLIIGQNPIGEGGILLTDKRYKDFELYLEVMPDWGCDGGVFLRSSEDGNAYQLAIDYVPDGLMGALIMEGLPKDGPGGAGAGRSDAWKELWKKDDWNSFRVRMTGLAPHIIIWLNDVEIVDFTDDRNRAIGGAEDGMIALQRHFTSASSWRGVPGGVHRFRNIAIKELN